MQTGPTWWSAEPGHMTGIPRGSRNACSFGDWLICRIKVFVIMKLAWASDREPGVGGRGKEALVVGDERGQVPLER